MSIGAKYSPQQRVLEILFFKSVNLGMLLEAELIQAYIVFTKILRSTELVIKINREN
jgi:hypothetical protein